MKPRTDIALRHLAIETVLVAIVVWLWRLGAVDLPMPPLSLDAVASWIDRHDAITLAFALTRLEALVLAGYLLVLTMASAVVRLIELPRATRLVDRVTLPALRGMFGGAAALGFMVIPSPIHHPAQTTTTTGAPTVSADDSGARATLHLEVPPPSPPPAPVGLPVPSVPADSWVVEPGDSLWSIAASHLADAHGAPADDDDVLVMWHRLIDLNRDRLVNPDDPDLIFADQVFELPAMETG